MVIAKRLDGLIDRADLNGIALAANRVDHLGVDRVLTGEDQDFGTGVMQYSKPLPKEQGILVVREGLRQWNSIWCDGFAI